MDTFDEGAKVKRTLLVLILLMATAGGASAQIVTATASKVLGTGGDHLKAEGTVSIVAGQTLVEVKIERGTIANGIFTPNNPADEKVLNPAVMNNAATYDHQFLTPLGAGTYSIKVTAKVTRPDPVTGIPQTVNVDPAYSTVTFQ